MSLNPFKKNNCRFCTYVSCCVKCRLQHEYKDHKINLDCDICLYGKTNLRNPSNELLNHIKLKHLPLRCSYCKNVFSTIEEILQNKCSFHKSEKVNMQATPIQNTTKNNDYLQIKVSNKNDLNTVNKAMYMKTSTPMHQFDESDLIKIIPHTITPIENAEKKAQSEMTPLKLVTQKVTFSEELSVQASSAEEAENKMNLPENGTIQINSKTTILKSLTMTHKTNFEVTLWNTAKENLNSSIETSDEKISVRDTPEINSPPKTGKFWSSLTEIFKNVAQIFLKSTTHEYFHVATPSIKRVRSFDSGDELFCPNIKKMKLTELKCRKPIHNCCTPRKFNYKKTYVDKWTQTEW